MNTNTQSVTYAQAARTLLRDTLLAAASDLLGESSWSEITMAAVAERAGVSRQTLYKEFHSREEFGQAFALHEARTFVAAAEWMIAAHPADPVGALRAAFEQFLRAAAKSPFVRAIFSPDAGGQELFGLFSVRGGPILSMATERLASTVCRQWPQADPRDARIVVESLVRLAISHTSLPTEPPARVAESLCEVFGHYIVRKLGL